MRKKEMGRRLKLRILIHAKTREVLLGVNLHQAMGESVQLGDQIAACTVDTRGALNSLTALLEPLDIEWLHDTGIVVCWDDRATAQRLAHVDGAEQINPPLKIRRLVCVPVEAVQPAVIVAKYERHESKSENEKKTEHLVEEGWMTD